MQRPRTRHEAVTVRAFEYLVYYNTHTRRLYSVNIDLISWSGPIISDGRLNSLLGRDETPRLISSCSKQFHELKLLQFAANCLL